jgi:glutamate-1-semialdehyde 2,1-aminomutase
MKFFIPRGFTFNHAESEQFDLSKLKPLTTNQLLILSQVTQRFAPSGIELVRFTNSGTEANTMALGAAVAFTGRKTILTFSNGYHGGTLTFHSPPSKTNVNLPHDFVVAPFNDIEGTRQILSSIPKDTLAAIIVEPVQGSGGCIVGTKYFLQFLNEEAHRLGALFIVDEVMTSRLSYHGYSAELGLRPDLVTIGKWVGGGMTFGAFGGRKDGVVMCMFDPRGGVLSHSGTFNNNIVTMAAGCAGMDIYTKEEVKRLNALGEDLKSSIEALIKKHGISEHKPSNKTESNELESPFTGQADEPSETRDESPRMSISGKGSMLAIHFSGESGNSLLALFWHHMLENGIYLAPRGFMALNMELKQKHVDAFVAATEEFVVKFKQALV